MFKYHAFWIIIFVFLRIIPHPPNYSPILAYALLLAATTKTTAQAITLLLTALIASDITIQILYNLSLSQSQGFFSGTPWLYLINIYLLCLSRFIRNGYTATTIIITTITMSLLFYFTTNFYVWLSSNYYEKSVVGLIACYIAAIPFFINNLIGNMVYTTAFFMITTTQLHDRELVYQKEEN